MNKHQKFIKNITKTFKNKYTLALLLFIIWISFIDDYNLIKKKSLQEKIHSLNKQKEYYLAEIARDSTKKNLLEKNEKEQERIAREKYLMKKENEDLFIIR